MASKKKQSSAKKAVDGAVKLSKKDAAKAKDAAKKVAAKAKERAKKAAAKAKAEAKEAATTVAAAAASTTGDTVVALRARARELGIPGYSRMSKAQLQERTAAGK